MTRDDKDRQTVKAILILLDTLPAAARAQVISKLMAGPSVSAPKPKKGKP